MPLSSSSWVEECPPVVARRIERLRRCRFTISEHQEPIKWTLRDERERTFRVRLGSPHQCSCKGVQPCLHTLFVLMDAVRLSPGNRVLWQTGIIEAELYELLSRLHTETGVCSLCREGLKVPSGCSECGQQFHWRCLFLRSQMKKEPRVECPNCRCLLKEEQFTSEAKCSGCYQSCSGQSYRCALCADYRLCTACYAEGRIHAGHPFCMTGPARHTQQTHEHDTNSLQYREIVPEDYEALLTLDSKTKRTLPASLFSKLPRLPFDSTETANTNCPVCLTGLVQEEVCVVLSCGHAVHPECGRKWFTEYSASCPIDHSEVHISEPQFHSIKGVNSLQTSQVISREDTTRARIALPPIDLKKSRHSEAARFGGSRGCGVGPSSTRRPAQTKKESVVRGDPSCYTKMKTT